VTAPVLSFVIPVRDDAARLARCLQSIVATPHEAGIEIIVADNGSTDASADVARRAGALVVSLPGRAVAEVRNQAAATARADLLAFVDADQEPAPGWTDAAVSVMRDPAIWAAGADYHAPVDGTWVQRTYDRLRAHDPGLRRVGWLPSGNLVIRRAAFETIGGFDTRLESCEDVDLCRRIREAGGTLVSADTLRSVHHGDPRTLRALFLAELWRGRDNLRVSLREPLTLRSAPSIAIPIVHLIALALVLVGVAMAAVGGLPIAPAALGVAAALTALRVGRLLSRVPPSERRWRQLPGACLVAAVYDAARALALVVRVTHDVRRKG
jgi:GT2 family glycosyltransferase